MRLCYSSINLPPNIPTNPSSLYLCFNLFVLCIFKVYFPCILNRHLIPIVLKAKTFIIRKINTNVFNRVNNSNNRFNLEYNTSFLKCKPTFALGLLMQKKFLIYTTYKKLFRFNAYLIFMLICIILH